MTPEQRQTVEDLTIKLHELENEEKIIEGELQKLRQEKAQIQARIAQNTDREYEENALSLLYAQRRNLKR